MALNSHPLNVAGVLLIALVSVQEGLSYNRSGLYRLMPGRVDM